MESGALLPSFTRRPFLTTGLRPVQPPAGAPTAHALARKACSRLPRAARCGYRRRECGAAAQQNAGRGPGPKPTDPLIEASHAGVTLSGVYAYAPPCPLRSTELAWLRLQSFGGDCREVQQKEANRVLNVLASTKRTINPASIATRRPDFPLAACDITKACKRARRLASLPP